MLWFGTLFSFVAFFMSTVVQSVVAFELTGMNRAVGYVVFAQGLAMFVFGPLGGAFADRWPKRRVVATAQLSAGAVFATLAAMVALERIAVWMLAAGSLVIGACFGFLGPARQALVVELVPESLRGNAVALSQVANTASRVVGPAGAGAVLAWPAAGAAGAYTLMALFYLAASTSLWFLPPSQRRPPGPRPPVWKEIADGLRYVRGHGQLAAVLGFFVAVMMLGFPYVTLLPGLVANAFGRPADEISFLYFVSALGALGASLGIARFADRPEAARWFAGMAVGFAASLALLAWSPGFAVAAAAMFAIGVTSGGFQTLNGAVVVRVCDPAFIGRVMSLSLLAFAGFGLMGLPIGALADAVGERAALACMAIGVAGLCAILGRRVIRTGPVA